MTLVLGRWNLASCSVNLHAAPAGLYVLVQNEDGIHRVPIENRPSIPYDQIVKVPFQTAFYPMVSRLSDGSFKVTLQVRGEGGCWFSCFKSQEEKQLKQPILSRHVQQLVVAPIVSPPNDAGIYLTQLIL